LDIGCGAGVLGIALKKINENITLYALDRDSIAVDFTRYNLKINNLNNNHVEGGLAFPETGSILFDLIVSNLPAKAGLPVLKYIITNAPKYLKHRGNCAFVIVKPLKDFFYEVLNGINADIIFTNHGKEHSVFIYTISKTEKENPSICSGTPGIIPYIRENRKVKRGTAVFTLKTVYGLSGFDTIDYTASLTMTILDSLNRENISGNILVNNPGQGYLPVYMYKTGSPAVFILTGRDLLSLETSGLNLIDNGFNKDNIIISHTHELYNLKKTYNLVVIQPYESSPVICEDFFIDNLMKIIDSKTLIIVSARSYLVSRFLRKIKKLSILKNRKSRGNRAIVFTLR